MGGFRWQARQSQSNLSSKIAHQLGCSSIIAQCLLNRNIRSLDDARQFLKDFNEKIDLIFLDPPFSKNIINEVVDDISKLNSINDRCKIYIEIPSKENFESSIITPRNWELLKCKKSGGVAYLLFQHNCSMI